MHKDAAVIKIPMPMARGKPSLAVSTTNANNDGNDDDNGDEEDGEADPKPVVHPSLVQIWTAVGLRQAFVAADTGGNQICQMRITQLT